MVGPQVTSRQWEIGKVMAGVITAVALATIAMVSQVAMGILNYTSNQEHAVAIEQVHKVGEKTMEISQKTETIVNSQKTAMEAKIEDLLKKITELERVVTEEKTRDAVGQERKAARDNPRDDGPQEPEKEKEK